jgi:hypothetical protein
LGRKWSIAANVFRLYDAQAVLTEESLRRASSNIRWRLAMGIVALAATVLLTFPAGAARQLEREVGEIWPNGLGQLADVIWPNDAGIDIIWPNEPLSQ